MKRIPSLILTEIFLIKSTLMTNKKNAPNFLANHNWFSYLQVHRHEVESVVPNARVLQPPFYAVDF